MSVSRSLVPPPERALLVATHNPGKLKELATLLRGLPFAVRSLAEACITAEAPEAHDTFRANAIEKATFYSRLTDALTLADDSGIEVEALGGGPGVLSARYGGPGLDDAERNALLLRELSGLPPDRRGARYVCVLALAQAGHPLETFEGAVAGRIATEPRGSAGFGYDPIFYFPPFARTFGETPPAEKDRVSHRGQALRALRAWLASRCPAQI